MDVSKHTLRTPSVIVDALLGRGDALDCYNQLQQEAKAIELELENNQLQRQIERMEQDNARLNRILDIIETLPDAEKAEVLKAVFGNFNPTPIEVDINKQNT